MAGQDACWDIYTLASINLSTTVANGYCYSIDGAKIWQIWIRPKGDKAVYEIIRDDNGYTNDGKENALECLNKEKAISSGIFPERLRKDNDKVVGMEYNATKLYNFPIS